MRKVELKLEPQKVQITQEEILADLRYPAPAGAPRARGPRGDRAAGRARNGSRR